MKTIITLLLLCCLMFELNAQEDSIKNAQAKDIKQKLVELNTQYEALKSEYKKELNYQSFKKEMDSVEKSDEFYRILGKYFLNKTNIDKLNAINEEAKTYKDYYKFEIKKDDLGIGDSLDDYFPNRENIKIDFDKNISEPKTFLYFGEDKVISENDSIFNNKEFNDIFEALLSEKSKAYFGDFIIPRDGQCFILYEYSKPTEIKVNFKSVELHLKHGLIQDIQIIVKDENEVEHLFENKHPISLLKYKKNAPKSYIYYASTFPSKNIDIKKARLEGHALKLSDVLNYVNNTGENFVPDEMNLSFPTKTDNVIDNLDRPVKYKIEQETSLENVLQLRAYTDFLSLFGDSPNGIFQFEGKGDFYINPFNIPKKNMFFFKKVSPYVNFARIDEEVRNIQVENNSITNSLEILEKAYLNMGAYLDLFSFKFSKEYPFETILYGKAQYNIADVKDVDSTSVNYKSLGLGGGLRIDIKRFNNFGFRMKSEFVNLNSDSFNTVNNLENTKDFVVFRNEAEIYYHPAEDSSQAVFLRLNTYNNSTENNNEAFYQLQFGYRFSIGINKLKN